MSFYANILLDKFKYLKIRFSKSRDTGFPTGFSTNRKIWKYSWKFVSILTKQCIAYFNLTDFFWKKFKLWFYRIGDIFNLALIFGVKIQKNNFMLIFIFQVILSCIWRRSVYHINQITLSCIIVRHKVLRKPHHQKTWR